MRRALLVLALWAGAALSIVADLQVRRSKCLGEPLIQFRVLQTHCEPGCVPMSSRCVLVISSRLGSLIIFFFFFPSFSLFSHQIGAGRVVQRRGGPASCQGICEHCFLSHREMPRLDGND